MAANPGAKSLKKHFSDLSDAVQNPLGLAAKLYSADVIDQSILEQIAESPVKTKQEKNVLLLKAVSSQVSQKPEVFERFLEILKKESYLDHITTTMALEVSTSHATSTGTDEEPSQRMPTKLEWKTGPAIPPGKRTVRGAAAAHGATAYFNSAESSTIYAYCSKRNQWLKQIECPRTDFGLEVVKEFLTLIGGKMAKAISQSGEVTNSLLSLPLGESGHVDWSEIFPSMPTKRMKPETACIGQYVAVIGGKEETKSSAHLNRVEVMDTGALQWHVCDSIPNISGTSWMTMAASDDTLYVSGRARNRYFLCSCSMQALLQSSSAKQGAIKVYPWQELQRPHVLTTHCTYTLTTLNGQLMAAGCEHIKVVTDGEDAGARVDYRDFGWVEEQAIGEMSISDDYDYSCQCQVYIYNTNSWIKLSDLDEMEPDSPLFVAVSGDTLILVGDSSYVRYTN